MNQRVQMSPSILILYVRDLSVCSPSIEHVLRNITFISEVLEPLLPGVCRRFLNFILNQREVFLLRVLELLVKKREAKYIRYRSERASDSLFSDTHILLKIDVLQSKDLWMHSWRTSWVGSDPRLLVAIGTLTHSHDLADQDAGRVCWVGTYWFQELKEYLRKEFCGCFRRFQKFLLKFSSCCKIYQLRPN